jgi:hypothetical protein
MDVDPQGQPERDPVARILGFGAVPRHIENCLTPAYRVPLASLSGISEGLLFVLGERVTNPGFVVW